MELENIINDFLEEEREIDPDWLDNYISKFESNEAFMDFMIESEQEARELAVAQEEVAKKKLELAKANKAKADRKKEILAMGMQRLGILKHESAKGKVSFRKSERVVIDEDVIDEYFYREKIVYNRDKAAIKEALKEGKEIKGATLEVLQNIQIK